MEQYVEQETKQAGLVERRSVALGLASESHNDTSLFPEFCYKEIALFYKENGTSNHVMQRTNRDAPTGQDHS